MLTLTRRGKKGLWQITGTIGGRRYRETTGTHSEPHAQVLLARRQAEILDRLTWGESRTVTFAEAALLYLERGGEARFLGPLNDHFGSWRLSAITPAEVARFAALTYPRCGPEGINRQVYTPLIAIFRCARDAGLAEPPPLKRPRLPERDAVLYATDADLARLLPACHERLRAAVLLLSFTGARASEACRLRPADVDWPAGTALLRRTKNGRPRVVPLAPMVLEALLPLRDAAGPLFGYASRYTLNQALARACRRAGLAVMSSHQVGRHAFSARLLRLGKTLKELQEAGDWSRNSYRLLAEVYGHLERAAVDRAVRAADGELAALLDPAKVVRLRTG